MKYSFAAALLLAFVAIGYSLRCYDCEAETNCQTNEVDCSRANGFCMKIDGIKDSTGKKVVLKRCTGAPSKQRDNCDTASAQGYTGIFCSCSSNLCNNADVKTMSQFVMISAILATVIIKFL